MEPVGFALGVVGFVEQAAHAIEHIRSLPEKHRSNPAHLETIQTLADSLFEQLKSLESRFNTIAPSLTSLQLTSLEFHFQSLNSHLGEVPSSLDDLHEAIIRPAYAWRRANRIESELKCLHDVLRNVEREAQALHSNLSTFETSDQSTAAVLDAVSRFSLLALILAIMSAIAAFVPRR
eukprot:GFKZ01013878.1.p1 GENE.GFKZ01013878.1~~GFKZ01013878.1.p1  ORF type:complete len:178 (-),score=22.46 GFKZ01013878.1:843-1376(-)